MASLMAKKMEAPRKEAAPDRLSGQKQEQRQGIREGQPPQQQGWPGDPRARQELKTKNRDQNNSLTPVVPPCGHICL